MAPVETTDAATVDQRCPFKHQTGWRHNHSNSKLCVAMRMGQANLLSISNCRLCAGRVHSSLHAQFSKRLDLCMSSLSRSPLVLHREKKNHPNLCVSSLCKPYLRNRSKKKTNSDLFLCRGHAAISRVTPSSYRSRATVFRRRNSVILAQGPCNSVQRKMRRQARHEVRTSGPALEGSIVSLLVNTMGGLSGGRRGGDVSGAASAPSLVVARLFCPSFGLGFGLRNPLPSLCHQEGIRQRRFQHTTT